MIKDCLLNTPTQRPTAEQLVIALEGMKDVIEGAYGELATVDAVRQVRTMKVLKSRSEDMVNESAAKDEEIQRLQQLVVRFNQMKAVLCCVHVRVIWKGYIACMML